MTDIELIIFKIREFGRNEEGEEPLAKYILDLLNGVTHITDVKPGIIAEKEKIKLSLTVALDRVTQELDDLKI